ncbi:YncE family protein [Nocardia cyriacigeorgica]|uniref:YncE family protein n=1 Tax=Nocardia cyriacigeorgica TaxID=135487 RepID=UPI0032D5998A
MTVLALLAGCSSDTDPDKVPTRDPATAAVSPEQATTPAGTVLNAPAPIGALVAEARTGRIAALDARADTAAVYLIDPGNPAPEATRTVALAAPGATVVQGAPGEVLIPTTGKVLRVDVTTGAITEVSVDADVRSVHPGAGGGLVIGTADGRVLWLDARGEVTDSVDGLISADALAVAGDRVAVLDRRQTSITEIDPAEDHLGLALRAGDGATNMIGDRFGRIVVTDTAGGELLVYTTAPLVLHQRFPVRSSPYALAYDPESDTVWVTCTQSNEVVGFDLSTGIPEEVGRYPTVGQPNSVTVDERSGDLFVGSATGDGLQRIRADERKRGQ